MPKYKIVCFLLAALMAAVGTVLVISNLTGDDIPDFTKPNEDVNTYLDRTEDMDIDDPNGDAIEFLFVAHKVLLSSKGFYGVAEGTTTAVGVKQNVRNARYVVGEFDNKAVLKEMVTKGVVGKAYQLYMQDANYIYRKGNKVNSLTSVDWASTAQALSEDAFYSDFGHRNDKLTGYILNWDTVKSGELVSKKDGLYTFHYVLDKNTATEYLIREMIFNGNLQSEPTFNKTEIYVTMDKDFNVKSLRTDCEYKAQTMGINASCTEDITEVITPYDGELPEKDFFEQYFDATPDEGIIAEETALDALLKMFSPYLGGESLQVALGVSAQGKDLVNALVSIDGLDIADLSKLTVNLRIGDVNLSYVHGNGAIYLKYKDFQGSTTVDGILNLASTFAGMLGDLDIANVMDASALDNLDVESLLDNLTYEVVGDKVVVNLPLSLGDTTVDAKLYGDVDGENYAFANAVINVGDVTINVTPSEWTVEERTGEYPEILDFAQPIINLINANGYAIDLDASVTVGDATYRVDAQLTLVGSNVHAMFSLYYNGTDVIDGELWVLNGVLYLQAGNVKLAIELNQAGALDDTADFNIDTVKQTLAGAKGYNDTVDTVVECVLNLLDAELAGITFDEIVPHMLFTKGKLTLDIDGSRFGLNTFTLCIGANDGLTLSISNLSYKNITLGVKKAGIAAYDGEISSPTGNVSDYVRIDEIFNDFYYGEGSADQPNGAIYNLINTYSWKIEFTDDETSLITINNESYYIGTNPLSGDNSYVVVYYDGNLANLKIRANINLYKYNAETKRYDKEFVLLDLVYIDGRIFVSYDSNSKDEYGGNVLRATLSIDAIKDSIDLLPALATVIPQLQPLLNVTGSMDGSSDSMFSDMFNSLAENINFGNLSQVFTSLTYIDQALKLQLNGKALNDSLGKVVLQVSPFGNEGVKLDQLILSYGDVSVDLNGVVITGSMYNNDSNVQEIMKYFSANEKSKGSVSGLDTVADSYNENNVYGHDLSNHMNLDSIHELLSALAITAGNFDENGRRSFLVEGNIGMNMNVVIAGVTLNIGVTMYADIDEDGYSYFALKLTRVRTRATIFLIPAVDVYNDYGGNSYLLFNSKTGMFTIMRDSIGKHEEHFTNSKTSKKCIVCDVDAENKMVGFLQWRWVCPNDANHTVEDVTTYYDDVRTVNIDGYESETYGEPGYIKTVTAQEFLAHIATDENGEAGYLLKMLNLVSLVESPILDAINGESDETSEYGIEDVLKDYSYGTSAIPNHKDRGDVPHFTVNVDLSPINNSLKELDLYITHDNDFNLTNIDGDFNIINIVKLNLELAHTTPGFGTAYHYVTDYGKENVDPIWVKWR